MYGTLSQLFQVGECCGTL